MMLVDSFFELCLEISKNSKRLKYGAYDQPSETVEKYTKSCDAIYGDRRYNNVGLRLVCMQ